MLADISFGQELISQWVICYIYRHNVCNLLHYFGLYISEKGQKCINCYPQPCALHCLVGLDPPPWRSDQDRQLDWCSLKENTISLGYKTNSINILLVLHRWMFPWPASLHTSRFKKPFNPNHEPEFSFKRNLSIKIQIGSAILKIRQLSSWGSWWVQSQSTLRKERGGSRGKAVNSAPAVNIIRHAC